MACLALSVEEERQIFSCLDGRGLKTLACLARELDINQQTLIKVNALRNLAGKTTVSRTEAGAYKKPRRSFYTEEEKQEILQAIHKMGSQPFPAIGYNFGSPRDAVHMKFLRNFARSDLRNVNDFASRPIDVVDQRGPFPATSFKVLRKSPPVVQTSSVTQEYGSIENAIAVSNESAFVDIACDVLDEIAYAYESSSDISDSESLAALRSVMNDDDCATNDVFDNYYVYQSNYCSNSHKPSQFCMMAGESCDGLESSTSFDNDAMEFEDPLAVACVDNYEANSHILAHGDGSPGREESKGICLSDQEIVSETVTTPSMSARESTSDIQDGENASGKVKHPFKSLYFYGNQMENSIKNYHMNKEDNSEDCSEARNAQNFHVVTDITTNCPNHKKSDRVTKTLSLGSLTTDPSETPAEIFDGNCHKKSSEESCKKFAKIQSTIMIEDIIMVNEENGITFMHDGSSVDYSENLIENLNMETIEIPKIMNMDLDDNVLKDIDDNYIEALSKDFNGSRKDSFVKNVDDSVVQMVNDMENNNIPNRERNITGNRESSSLRILVCELDLQEENYKLQDK